MFHTDLANTDQFFILVLFFLKNQKQESGFQQTDSMVTRSISVFCLQRVALFFKPCRIRQIFNKKFSYMLFLFVLQLHVNSQVPYIVKPVLKTTFLKRPTVLNDHVVVLPNVFRSKVSLYSDHLYNVTNYHLNDAPGIEVMTNSQDILVLKLFIICRFITTCLFVSAFSRKPVSIMCD